MRNNHATILNTEAEIAQRKTSDGEVQMLPTVNSKRTKNPATTFTVGDWFAKQTLKMKASGMLRRSTTSKRSAGSEVPRASAAASNSAPVMVEWVVVVCLEILAVDTG